MHAMSMDCGGPYLRWWTLMLRISCAGASEISSDLQHSVSCRPPQDQSYPGFTPKGI